MIKLVQIGKKNVFIQGNVNVKGDFIIESEKEVPQVITALPYFNPRDFIGRSEDLQNFHSLLMSESRTVLVNGMAGIGKTSFIQHYLKTWSHLYDHICWINIMDLVGIRESFLFGTESTELIDSLMLAAEIEKIKPEKRTEEGFKLIINRLRNLEGHNLLVLDNIPIDAEDARILKYLHLNENWKIVATSRNEIIGFDHFRLGILPLNETLRLFYKNYVIEQNDLLVKEIIDIVENHTLAIETISKSAQEQRKPLAEVIVDLKKKA